MSKGLLEDITRVFRPQTALWACEFTSKHIIVAGVSKGRSHIAGKIASELPDGALTASHAETNIRNIEVVRYTLRDLLSQSRFKGSEIAVVVPDDTARIALLTAENLSKKQDERQTYIRWKLKKSVPFDVDTAQVAYSVLGPHRSGQGVDMLVALSPRAIVEEYENLFDAVDIHAGSVLPSTLAALNLFKAPSGDSLFLKIAPDCITTTIFQNRQVRFYRRVTEASLYDAVYPTVMYYQDKLGGKTIEQLAVCGYTEDLQSQLAELQEKLGLSPQRLDPKSVDDIFKPALGAMRLRSEGAL